MTYCMCGMAGWVSYQRDLTRHTGIVAAMTETMVCRGPDADGMWTATQTILGHRRLSIIDLAGGRQPMVADEQDSTQAVITYTGEVYNFRELRDELRRRGHRFRTVSDTEVVLRAYVEGHRLR
jgi:asparagine synthase (glutamine-hydrolysing)